MLLLQKGVSLGNNSGAVRVYSAGGKAGDGDIELDLEAGLMFVNGVLLDETAFSTDDAPKDGETKQARKPL